MIGRSCFLVAATTCILLAVAASADQSDYLLTDLHEHQLPVRNAFGGHSHKHTISDTQISEGTWQANLLSEYQDRLAALDVQLGKDLDESKYNYAADFQPCEEEFDDGISKVIGTHGTMKVFWTTVDGDAFFAKQDFFLDLAAGVSSVAFYFFLVIEFIRERGEIMDAMGARDKWERVVNRVFETWVELSIPNLVRTGAIIPRGGKVAPVQQGNLKKSALRKKNASEPFVTEGSLPSVTPVYKKQQPISYLYTKEYELGPNCTWKTIAYKLVGALPADDSRIPRHVAAAEIGEKSRMRLCHNCSPKGATREEILKNPGKYKDFIIDGKYIATCMPCSTGLTYVLDALAGPVQSYRSSAWIFKAFFSWDIFREMDVMREAKGELKERTFYRQDFEDLLFNFWDGVSARAGFLWRLIRQVVTFAIFFGYFFTSYRWDFLGILIAGVVKLFLFWQGYSRYFNQKAKFAQFVKIIDIVHWGECFFITMIYWLDDGYFRSAAIAWRIIQELEVHPMAFVVHYFTWWHTSIFLLLQMFSMYIKLLWRLARHPFSNDPAVYAKIDEADALKAGMGREGSSRMSIISDSGSGSDSDGGRGRSKSRRDSHRASSGDRSRSASRGRKGKTETKLEEKAKTEALDRYDGYKQQDPDPSFSIQWEKKRQEDKEGEETKEHRSLSLKEKIKLINQALSESFVYMSLSSAGHQQLKIEIENWLLFNIEGEDKSQFLCIGAQDRSNKKYFRARRIIPRKAIVDIGGNKCLDLNVSDNLHYNAFFTKSKGKLIRHALGREAGQKAFGGVFAADAIFLTNTSYWWNAFHLVEYPATTSGLFNNMRNFTLPNERDRRDGQSEIDIGVVPSESVVDEWPRWERNASFENDKDAPIKQIDEEWDALERNLREGDAEADAERLTRMQHAKQQQKYVAEEKAKAEKLNVTLNVEKTNLTAEIEHCKKHIAEYEEIIRRQQQANK